MLLPLAGVAVALLAGLGLWRMRAARKSDGGETSFLESRLQPDSFFGASGGQRVDTHDSSEAPSSMSYSLSQLDAIGDVDPVAEADVYLAYGRDLQAEEILKEAMRSSPDRLAIRTKLLEVYAKRRDTKGFELLAAQLHAMTGGHGEDWDKAQSLGLSIDPENPLYQPGRLPGAARRGEHLGGRRRVCWAPAPLRNRSCLATAGRRWMSASRPAPAAWIWIWKSIRGATAPTGRPRCPAMRTPISSRPGPLAPIPSAWISRPRLSTRRPRTCRISPPRTATTRLSCLSMMSRPTRISRPGTSRASAAAEGRWASVGVAAFGVRFLRLHAGSRATLPSRCLRCHPAGAQARWRGRSGAAAAAVASAAGGTPSAYTDLDLDVASSAAPSRPDLDAVSRFDFADSTLDVDGDPLARKMELAEEFLQIGDVEGARDLLREVATHASGALKSKAQGMLDDFA